jgi:hypothetical protein
MLTAWQGDEGEEPCSATVHPIGSSEENESSESKS